MYIYTSIIIFNSIIYFFRIMVLYNFSRILFTFWKRCYCFIYRIYKIYVYIILIFKFIYNFFFFGPYILILSKTIYNFCNKIFLELFSVWREFFINIFSGGWNKLKLLAAKLKELFLNTDYLLVLLCIIILQNSMILIKFK